MPRALDIPHLPETEHAVRMAEDRALGLPPPASSGDTGNAEAGDRPAGALGVREA